MKKAGEELGFFPRYDLHTALREYVPYLRERYQG
jgi:nucleoside-diphosphate-sugar epimerase